MSRDKVCVITHGSDPDGIISNVFLQKFAEIKDPGCRMDSILAEHETLGQEMKKICQNCYNKVYIADLPLSETVISKEELLKLSEHTRIYYFDHHCLSENREKTLSEVCVIFYREDHMCAAKIILDSILEQNDLDMELAEIAQATDFNILNQHFILGEKLRRVINNVSAESLKDFIQLIKEYKAFENGEINKDFRRLEESVYRQEQKAKQELLANCRTVRAGKYCFVIGYTTPILYMKPALIALAMSNPVADAAVILGKDKNNVGISAALGQYAREIPVVEFCFLNKGGGRNNAGGYQLDKKVTDENYDASLNYVTQTFKEYLELKQK